MLKFLVLKIPCKTFVDQRGQGHCVLRMSVEDGPVPKSSLCVPLVAGHWQDCRWRLWAWRSVRVFATLSSWQMFIVKHSLVASWSRRLTGLSPGREGLRCHCFHQLEGILLFLKNQGPICHSFVLWRVSSSWGPGSVSFHTDREGSAPSISILGGTTGAEGVGWAGRDA